MAIYPVITLKLQLATTSCFSVVLTLFNLYFSLNMYKIEKEMSLKY